MPAWSERSEVQARYEQAWLDERMTDIRALIGRAREAQDRHGRVYGGQLALPSGEVSGAAPAVNGTEVASSRQPHQRPPTVSPSGPPPDHTTGGALSGAVPHDQGRANSSRLPTAACAVEEPISTVARARASGATRDAVVPDRNGFMLPWLGRVECAECGLKLPMYADEAERAAHHWVHERARVEADRARRAELARLLAREASAA